MLSCWRVEAFKHFCCLARLIAKIAGSSLVGAWHQGNLMQRQRSSWPNARADESLRLSLMVIRSTLKQLGLHHGLVLLLQEVFISAWHGRVVLLRSFLASITLISATYLVAFWLLLIQTHLTDYLCANPWVFYRCLVSAIRSFLVVDHVGCRQYVGI